MNTDAGMALSELVVDTGCIPSVSAGIAPQVVVLDLE